MGAGRKTSTYSYDSANNYHGKPPPKYRDLSPEQLGGVIFGTTKDTFKECVDNLLFGLPRSHIRYVGNITDGMPVFLFNYSDRKLHGVYVADGHGELDIKPSAWSSNSQSLSSPYPAQVKVKLWQDCKQLAEGSFASVLEDNYYSNTHFMFEVDHAQVANLLKLFTGRSTLQPVRTIVAPMPSYGQTMRATAVPPLSNAWTQKPSAWTQTAASSSDTSYFPSVPAPDFAPSAAKSANGKQRGMEETEGFDLVANDASSSSSQPVQGNGKGKEGVEMNGEHCVDEDEEEKTKKFVEKMKQVTLEEMERKKMEEDAAEKLHVAAAYQTAGAQLQTSTYLSPKGRTNGLNNGGSRPSSSGAGSSPAVDYSAPAAGAGSANGRIHVQTDACARHTQNGASQEEYSGAGRVDYTSPAAYSNGQSTSLESLRDWEARERERAVGEQKVLQADRLQLVERMKDVDSAVAQSIQRNVELCAAAIFQMRQDSMDLRRVMDAARTQSTEHAEIAQLRTENQSLRNQQLALEYQVQVLQQQMVALHQHMGLHFPGSHSSAGQILVPNWHQGQASIDQGSVEMGGAFAEEVPAPHGQSAEIYIMGGRGEESWLCSVDVYSPDNGTWHTRAPMLSNRSYAATAVLDEHIYVFGGGDGSVWYDSVECYSKEQNSWSQCTPLRSTRGSLGGVTCQGHIYAVGGGTSDYWLNDVEQYDAAAGVWLSQAPMLEKRFCVAAVELKGAVYAVGGFDGRKYLMTVERFDPREGLWAQVQPMRLPRGSLSAAVLDDKLYALGGFDGATFMSSVEVYDPRANQWQEGPSLSLQRGYSAAAVVDDALYCIAGFSGDAHTDIVERYTESEGWVEIPRSADTPERRSFMASAVL